MEEFDEILQDFLVEAFELIEQLDQDLVELETSPEDLELLNRIFRVAHTVKGASSFLNFDVLTHLTHHMENILNKARHGELKITPDIMDIILESIDLMKALLETIRDTGSDEGLEVDACVGRLDRAVGGEEEAEAPVPAAPAEAPAPEPEPEPAAEAESAETTEETSSEEAPAEATE